MKILVISRGWPSKKTPQWGCFERDQAMALKNAGHEVIVMSVDGRIGFHQRRFGVTHKFEDGIHLYNIFLFPLPLLSILGIKYLIRSFIALYLFKKIVNERGMIDVIYSHYLFNTYSAVRIKNKYNIPLVAIEHWSKLNMRSLPYSIMKIGRTAYSKADRVIVVSKILQQRLRCFFSIDSIVIYNMCGSEFNNLHTKNTKEQFIFISVGRLVKHKRFDLIIQAFHKAHFQEHVKLLIVGVGPEMYRLKKMLSVLSMDKQVVLTGPKTKDELSSLLHQCNVFVLASRGETFGVSCIEALMSGLPVISTRCGGPEEFINERNGCLVPIDNVEALSLAMQDIYRKSSFFDSAQISKECFQRFSSDVIVEQIEKVLKEVVNK
ncbi:glycosyltransferase [uncultured Bacteroides sp.]|uniref:glycosyltransferase n=1 Tax=uncultured Bacteroides sp. TaxID=162156 RepID=UPI0026056F3C|nr:glycosyltransferase [uncultured Bacteroides sp.]